MGGSRSSGGVVPMVESGKEYARLGKYDGSRSPRAPMPASSPGRRLIPARGWLMLFLLVNLFSIAVFIFSSAVYFPSTATSGVVKQVINQGDMSLLELTGRGGTESPVDDGETPTPVDDNTLEMTKPPETTSEVSPTESGQQQTPERKPRLRSEDEPTEETTTTVNDVPAVDEVDITTVVGDPDAHVPTEVVSFPSIARSDEAPEPMTAAATTQPAVTTIEPLKSSPPSTPEATLAGETATVELRQGNMDGQLDHEAFETNLFVWLKADEGVEVENAAECETLGSACDVKVWKSAMTDANQGSVVFEPVSAAMRPVLQPMAQNSLPLVSFSCGMVHSSGVVLHDMMTLFFVLKPSRIEPGDTYRAQKFFGNSPYGQFLFHGGKPAFFTTGGLRGSDFVASNDELVLLTYRLRRHAVEIKANGQQWSLLGDEDDESFLVRMSGNAALSLANVKSACDTNAFQGLMAEVLIYDSVLSNKRVDQVEQYLLSKWWGSNAPTTATYSEPTQPEVVTPELTMQVEVENPVTNTMALNPNGDDMTLESEAPPTSPTTTEPSLETQTEPGIEAEQDPTVQQDEKPKDEDQTIELSDEEVDETESYPRTFDPEGVFEWLPPGDLLAAINKHKGVDTAPLVDQWKKTVREKVDSVRNFQLGGEVLRSFIRSRRDELLALREELFG